MRYIYVLSYHSDGSDKPTLRFFPASDPIQAIQHIISEAGSHKTIESDYVSLDMMFVGRIEA